MSFQTVRFASERDFVAQFLLPKLKEAAKLSGVADVTDFYFEKSINGTPDLTIEKGGKGLLVVEAKFKKRAAGIERDIEPRDPDVIAQAVNYAVLGGFPYYATCNSKRLVLFQLRPGVKAYESEIASFEYERSLEWAESVLKTVLELVPIRLKPLDDTLVDTLHEAVNDLYPEFLAALKQRLQNVTFREAYVEWLESQGLELTDETNRLIAEQTTYLQLNKLLFYQVIRTIYPDRLGPLNISEEDDVSEALASFFAKARKIDYAPVYQSDIISEIPFTPRAKERVRTLLDTLNEFDFSRIESDFIGRIYEKLIPPAERKRLGQFYTPSSIVDFIVQLTVTKPDDVVLDPGCGSGSFLVRAYHRLRELNHIPRVIEGPLAEKFHQQLLERLYGVDINQFPAHLTVINLAVQNPKARIEKINVIVNDIFDVRPRQAVLSGFESITAEGKPTLVEMPPAFDAVLANPPYIRQELLGEKGKLKVKALVESEYKGKLFIGAPLKKIKGAPILDKQSDIYVYFYIHGLRFLKNGGKLGFISSNKWLEVGYGEPFQQFLLDNMKILHVVEFDRAIFPDAEVNTAVTILQKEGEKSKRNKNLVKFVRVKKRLDMKILLERIQSAEESMKNDELRINIIQQGKLKAGKWNIYLRAPPVYSKIKNNSKVKLLEEITDVLFGLKTGYNPFFVISREDAEQSGIEKEYLKPMLYSPKDLRGLVVRSGAVRFVLTTEKSKSELKGTSVLNYIEHGEKLRVEVSRGSERKPRYVPELESVRVHKPFWYCLPKLKEPDIFLAQCSDKRLIVALNEAREIGSDNFLLVTCKNRDNVKAIFGYLCSSVGAICGELHSRSYGGGVLKMQAYEAKKIPVIDPPQLTDSERSAIEKVVDSLIVAVDSSCKAEEHLNAIISTTKRNYGLFEAEARKELEKNAKAEEQARRKLDEAVYDALGLTEEERNQVEEGLRELQELRRLRTQT